MFRALAQSMKDKFLVFQGDRFNKKDSNETKPVSLQRTPFSQCDYNNNGFCTGAALTQAMDEKDVPKALAAQAAYEEKYTRSFHKYMNKLESMPGGKPEGSSLTKIIRNLEISKVAKLFVKTNNLKGKVGQSKIMLQPDEGSLDNASEFLKKETVADEKATFLSLIKTSTGQQHLLRVNAEYGQCSLYDGNDGLTSGKCEEIHKVYNDFLKNWYKATCADVLKLPHNKDSVSSPKTFK